jgi:mannose-6-phosphate isomerase
LAAALDQEIRTLRTWLRDKAWPLWLTKGLDHGRRGFYEALDLQTHTCGATHRRLRVVARQITVFSQAHADGLPGADHAVHVGLEFLAHHAAQHDGGYAWRFNLHHEPIDRTRDLYDHAFVLLALASATIVVGVEALRVRALSLLHWLDAEFTHPAGGYVESLPPAMPRRQNPHMHLLEALLAAHQAFGDEIYLHRANALVALFAQRLFDAETGALPEFFDDALEAQRISGTFLVEPGHHCEWVWLLHEARAQGVTALSADQIAGMSVRLMAFVDRFGLHTDHGCLMDALASDGTVRSASARLWPQTERLRAEFLRPDASMERQLAAARALAAYVRPDGLWHERRLAAGEFSEEPAPASSLYHLTGAIRFIAAPMDLSDRRHP